jgi:hypothetical protein
MKKLLTAVCVLLITGTVSSQALSGSATYKQKNYAAAVIDLPYSTDVVHSAMNEFLSKKGKSRKDDLKGFVIFRNTQLNSDQKLNADLYFKVENRNRKDKNSSTVSLLLGKPETEVNEAVNNMDMAKATAYLDELAKSIGVHNLELMINDQNKSIIRSEENYRETTSDGLKLKNKMASLQKDIEENTKKQEGQLADVNLQKQKLSVLVSQRKQ